MKWTLKHYYPFGRESGVGDSLLSAAAWERLRTSTAVGGASEFHLPATRSDWLGLCQGAADAAQSAGDIAEVLRRRQVAAVHSIGVGRACVEFHLKARLPDLKLTCTEYSPLVVNRLRQVFTECDSVILFDIMADSWPALEERTLVLLNRVDTELDDAQWQRAFARMAEAGVKEILLVATAYLTPAAVVREAWVRLAAIRRRSPLSFAGYVRTKSRLRDLWRPHYREVSELLVGSLAGFLLTRRR